MKQNTNQDKGKERSRTPKFILIPCYSIVTSSLPTRKEISLKDTIVQSIQQELTLEYITIVLLQP